MPAKHPKEYAHNHYHKNKGRYVESSKRSRQNRKEWYFNFMKDHSCVRCGVSNPILLDWHHLDPTQKDMNVSEMMNRRSRKAVLDEIAKCVCLCANCHRLVHYEKRWSVREDSNLGPSVPKTDALSG
jgi:hypothetical protein